MKLNVGVNWFRRRFDMPYWSLSKHAKSKVKNAVEFISRFEKWSPTKPGPRRWTAWCAAISTRPMCRHYPASLTTMTAIGWRARRWSSISTGRLEILHWADWRSPRAATRRAAGRRLMRLLIVTDAWTPQVNGVVRTLQAVRAELERMGHHVALISPDQFRSLPCPTYPEIRLALAWRPHVAARIAAARPDAIHIATEGPLGLAARRWCLQHGFPFTTAYHTQFPDYLAQRTRLSPDWFWRYIQWFHAPASAILVATPSIERSLHSRGLTHTRSWGRGVDLQLFRPDGPPHPAFAGLPRPIRLYVGRVAPEKNVETFLHTRGPGSLSSSAMARPAPISRRFIPKPCSWAPCTATRSPPPIVPQTCSSSPAAPIRSASS
jgi:hypothetical protein